MTVGPEVRSILECLVSDDLEPAIAKLDRAATVTNEQLREEFFSSPCRPKSPV